MAETQAQIDIFGETQSLKPEPTGYLARGASARQCVPMRLFEPQMEGQLVLESATPPGEGRRRGATTVDNDRSAHDG